MTTPTEQSQRLPLFPLAGADLFASIIGGVTVLGLSVIANWAVGREAGLAVGLAAGTVIAATLAGLTVLALLASQDSSKLAVATVAAGIVRMLASLAIGLCLYLILSPEGRTFWTAFLVCNILCLLVETAWGMVTNQRVHAQRAAHAGATK